MCVCVCACVCVCDTRTLQDILDQWLKCQGKWLYLEPIFGAEEIMKQIPKEGQAFRDMDAIWRRIMKRVQVSAVRVYGGLMHTIHACRTWVTHRLADSNARLGACI